MGATYPSPFPLHARRRSNERPSSVEFSSGPHPARRPLAQRRALTSPDAIRIRRLPRGDGRGRPGARRRAARSARSRRSPSAEAGRVLAGSGPDVPDDRPGWRVRRPHASSSARSSRHAGPPPSPPWSPTTTVDRAPRLARWPRPRRRGSPTRLRRSLLAGAIAVTPDRREPRSIRWPRRSTTFAIDEPVVVTLQPGVRGVVPRRLAIADETPLDDRSRGSNGRRADARRAPAAGRRHDGPRRSPRIVGGGAGLDGADRFAQLAGVASALDAAMGATRVDHRPRLGRPRAPDRHHRRGRRSRSCTSRSASAAPCSTPPGSATRTTSSASTPTRTAR